ncbi:MAG: sigma-54-dependent Fis family transcriptional regulator [Candidatus Omnitrophica bacterium]|nr:sigma-54-dependent Fis family transcriptional regulator [Candidatus Omnitrophota bacterium]
MKTHVLITDDEPLVRKSLKETLRYQGYNVTTAKDGVQALEILKNYSVDILMTDMKMPNLGGMDLLRQVRKQYPRTQVVLMSAYGQIENAVEAMRLGAVDYISKPFEDAQITDLLKKIDNSGGTEVQSIDDNGNTNKIAVLPQRHETGRHRFHAVLGKDEKMQNIYSMIEAIADTSSTVLIHGESGTGKRMVAQSIHQADEQRRSRPFIEISCGALPETLLESELFGHVKGSFTGAIKDRAGRFELANGGTILLDEIDTCSSSLQVKLLRILEEGHYERVGDVKTLTSDVRVIAATNQKLEELVKLGSFRGDLFWRLNVINIDLPPLRDRVGDIPLLVQHFLDKYNLIRTNRNGGIIESVAQDTMDKLMHYSWPGNIRELENTVERACILVRGNCIHQKDLPDSIKVSSVVTYANNTSTVKESFSLKTALKHPERDIILDALTHTNWNCTRTAAYLGINRTTLYNKMKLYGIKRGNGR